MGDVLHKLGFLSQRVRTEEELGPGETDTDYLCWN